MVWKIYGLAHNLFFFLSCISDQNRVCASSLVDTTSLSLVVSFVNICENVFPEGKSSQHNKNAVGTLGFVRHDKQQKEAHFGVSRKTGEMQQHSESH